MAKTKVKAPEHAVGTRKRATAKVWLKPGEGKFKINGKQIEEYLKRMDLVLVAKRPLEINKIADKFDVNVQVRGGGLSAQASAVSLGIARGLSKLDPDLHKTLKDEGLLTRDPREKERMKYGLAKRRKSFQWTKR
ncbi:30S ribosomal protein S9 [candidate division WOR-3 bacterium]|nr:30S ribosomal protein S9 [candidate division WOR-3 bacterium]